MAVPFTRSIVCPMLIGRRSQLDTLVQFMEQAYSEHGQTVLITGEAGIGKSRLVAEIIRYARSSSNQTESQAALILELPPARLVMLSRPLPFLVLGVGVVVVSFAAILIRLAQAEGASSLAIADYVAQLA